MRKRNGFLFFSALPSKEEVPFYLVEQEEMGFKAIVQADMPEDVKAVIYHKMWGDPKDFKITYVGYPHKLKKEKESWLIRILKKILTYLED